MMNVKIDKRKQNLIEKKATELNFPDNMFENPESIYEEEME